MKVGKSGDMTKCQKLCLTCVRKKPDKRKLRIHTKWNRIDCQKNQHEILSDISYYLASWKTSFTDKQCILIFAQTIDFFCGLNEMTEISNNEFEVFFLFLCFVFSWWLGGS